ncbi:hypothetical protein FO519_001557 [Halicephalobus sp. NKZ332]|nr:hypothetical protein FO519_001557 [Halicephalobus sp. NKZ332]
MSVSAKISLLKKEESMKPEQKHDIFTKIKFKNQLPDVPMEPRFMQLPVLKLSRFADYKTTDIERNYRFELTTERDLDINVDLINTKKYEAVNEHDLGIPGNMHPDDRELVEDETKHSHDKRRQNHNEVVSWMRKTQYLGIENVRFGVGADRQETKIGYKLFKSGITDQLYKDRQGQIDTIKKTFDDAKIPCKEHPTKRGVHAVEEFQVLPDFDSWHLPYAQVLFDGDPIPFRTNKDKLMERAVSQGVKDTDGKDFVAYYVPTDETLKKLLEKETEGTIPDNSEQLEYKCTREFNWTVRNENSKGYEPNFFFSFRGGACYYNDMNTRVKLTRKPKGSGAAAETMYVYNDEVNENEKTEFEKRLSRLTEREIQMEEPEPEEPSAEEKEKGQTNLNDIFGDNESEESESTSDDSDDSDEDSEDSEPKKKPASSSSSSSDSD